MANSSRLESALQCNYARLRGTEKRRKIRVQTEGLRRPGRSEDSKEMNLVCKLCLVVVRRLQGALIFKTVAHECVGWD